MPAQSAPNVVRVLADPVRRVLVARTAAALRLLAAPTFVVMAALSAAAELTAPSLICGMPHGWTFNSMSGMYLLMAAFHLPAWFPREAAGADDNPHDGVKL